MGGLSDINFEGNKEDTTGKNLYGSENENTRVDYGSGIGGISLDIQTSAKSNLKVTAGYSTTAENFEGDSISTETRKAFLSGKARFRTQKYSFNGQYSATEAISCSLFKIMTLTFSFFEKNFLKSEGTEIWFSDPRFAVNSNASIFHL